MIKVCHMTSAHAPEDVRIFHKECVSLAKAGYDVYLVERGESYEKEGVHIVGVGQPAGGRFSRITRFSQKVYEVALSLDADIYHLHDPELLPYGLKLKRKGKKVIFDSHERYSMQLRSKPYLPAWCTKMIADFYSTYERYVLKRIDAVIFPCTFNGEKLYEGVCPRSILIDNVAKLEEMYDRYVELETRQGLPMCFVGSLSEARCVTEIVQAAKLANIPLILAGEFSSSAYKKEIQELISHCEGIKWIGSIPHDEVITLLQNASAGLCPEKNVAQYNTVDNLATKSYEYMAMALPVVVAAYPFSSKVMETYQYGIQVNPDSVEEIAAAMRYLWDNPEEAKRMGENGRRAIKEKFNWEIEEKKLLALYEDILKG